MAEERYLDDLAAFVILRFKMKSRNRTIWAKEWLLKRRIYTHTNILQELRAYPTDFNNFLRMDESTYLYLLQLIRPMIEKQSTVMREAISPHQRLTATLRFLATGATYQDLKFSSCISAPSLSQIIPQTCSAIYGALVAEYMKFPKSREDWLYQAHMFEDKWQFPNCVGAVDGKHIAIVPPPESGSYFYNYKGFHSMVLMAIANANYELLYAHFGTNGRVSDGGVIECTGFNNLLSNNLLNLPGINPSNGLPYVFVSDEAFALRENMLKPYSVKMLDHDKRIFNYRLSRARRVVENVFGILVARFGVLQKKINLNPDNIDIVVMTCCVLHNFLRRHAAATYTPPESIDTENEDTHEIRDGHRAEGENIASIGMGHTRNSPEAAKLIRDRFKVFLNCEGSVPWQENHV